MANRGIRQLLALREAEYRFYMGSYADFGPNGYNGTPNGGIPLRRCIGQVVGATPRAAGEFVDAVLTILANTAWSWEFHGILYDGGGAGFGRLFECAAPTSSVYNTEVADIISWNSGAILNSSGGSVPPNRPLHMVGAKDAAGNGHFYFDGIPDVSGPVGTNGITTVRFFERPILGRYLRTDCFLIRFFNTEIDPDEAALLYEHSRIQLWPGAPKRSGIVSPVL